MRRTLPSILLSLSALFALAGCSSAPKTGGDETTTTHETAKTTQVTIVGWSLRDQAPVAVKGVLRQGGREVSAFDTKAHPEGTTIAVAPGPYEVEVTHRLAGDRLIPATGLERVDASPNEIARCEVVIDDREGSDAPPTRADTSR